MKKEEFELLKQRLQAYVPYLPALLPPVPAGADGANKNTSRAFSAYVLEKLFGISQKLAAESVTDDWGDQGIDAIYYHQADRSLYLVQSKLKETAGLVQEDVQPFIAGIRLLLTQGDLDQFNANFKVRENEIDQALNDCLHIKLILAYTGAGPTGPVKAQINQFIQDRVNVDERLSEHSVEYDPATAFSDLLLEKAQQPVDKVLVVYGNVKNEHGRAAYYGSARLFDLADWYTKEGKKILEKNIRFSLGANKTSVNKAIFETLKDEPSNFFFLNNGVTLLASEIQPMRGSNASRKFGLNGVSIINGAQTVATASSYFTANPEADRDSARVMVTLIRVGSEDAFGTKVTKARNNQNPVAASAFAALDSVQENLSRTMAHMGWAYHFRPEAAEGSAAERQLRIDEVSEGLALFHPNPSMPLLLKTEPSRLRTFGSGEYSLLFNPATLSARKAIVSVLYSREVLSRFDREASHKSNTTSERAIYRHGKFAMTWLLFSRNIGWVDAAAIPTAGEVAAAVDAVFDNFREAALEEAKARIVYKGPLAFFRSATDTRPYIDAVRAKLAAD